MTKRIFALLLAVLLIACAGCGEETPKRRKKKVIVVRKPDTVQSDEVTSEEETPSDTDSTYDDTDDNGNDGSNNSSGLPADYVRRELASKTAIVGETCPAEYTSSVSGWNGPAGYVIVYPKGSIQLKHMALQLQNYFEQEAGIKLTVTDDSAKAVEKELLVGDTARRKSKLKETQYAVTLSGGKLIFESGNFNGVIKAVKWFISLDYQKGKVNLIKGNYGFESTKKRENGEYKFVWGDDFDGNALDPSHWNLTLQMDSLGQSSLVISSEKENINVSDGTLRISGTRAFDLKNKDVKYAAPYSVSTRYKMNFLYGYMELRARYPAWSGSWPSWWMTGNCKDGPAAVAYPNAEDRNNAGNILKTSFFAEIDILEYTNAISNIHKWYFDGKWTQLNAYRPCNPLERTEEDSYVYHVYGFEWDPKEIKVYCDGKLYNRVDITTTYDDMGDMADFQNPMEMMFNNHVQPGGVPMNNAAFPFDYYIDYVRLYQKDGEGGLWIRDRDKGTGTLWSNS